MSVITRLRDAGFEVYTRAQWGSPRERDGSYAKRAGNPYYQLAKGLPYHFLHLSVTRDGDTVAEGKAGARQIETYGYTTPPMVSYQMLVTNEGRLFEGQNYGVKGTHTVNDKKVSGFPEDLNRYGYAVALMQNIDDEVTDVQVVAVAAAFAAAELEGWVKRGAPIYPHRTFAYKACPGDLAVARLGEIEALKNQLVAAKLPRGARHIGVTEPEDDMAAEDVWKVQLNVIGEDERIQAGLMLRQSHNRAGGARTAAQAAVQGVRDLAQLIGNTGLSEAEKAALAQDIADRTAAAVERLDAEAVAERLEITTKEN